MQRLARVTADLPADFEAWTVVDETPDTSYLYQTEPDFSDRREAFERGLFGFVGIVLYRRCECCGENRVVDSLWGIEDDSGPDYFREIAENMVDEVTS